MVKYINKSFFFCGFVCAFFKETIEIASSTKLIFYNFVKHLKKCGSNTALQTNKTICKIDPPIDP